MKIKKFAGDNIYGYLPINLIFNDDLSIITGINGSGKTTAILLMQAILCPNFKDLLSIPFDFLSLEYQDGLNVETIYVKSIGKSIYMSHSKVETLLHIDKNLIEEVDFNDRRKEKLDINEYLKKSIGHHEVLEIIKLIPSPTFIGLERRNLDFRSDVDEYMMGRRNLSLQRKSISRIRREFKGTLGISLLETEFIVQESYGRIKNIEERYSNALKDQIILSSFDYISIENAIFIDNMEAQRNLLSRRSEIESALNKIEYSDKSAMNSKLKEFFTKFESLVQSMEEGKDAVKLEWLINRLQIDKLIRVLNIIDDNNSKIEKYFKPFNLFVKTINEFFSDSGKKIEIDSIGQIYVKNGSTEPQSIDALSSGERQLLIIFANVIFNESSNRDRENILIIDEPEISLHIRWQEKFIDLLFAVNPKAQFIIATHSPDITGDFKKKSIKINATNPK